MWGRRQRAKAGDGGYRDAPTREVRRAHPGWWRLVRHTLKAASWRGALVWCSCALVVDWFIIGLPVVSAWVGSILFGAAMRRWGTEGHASAIMMGLWVCTGMTFAIVRAVNLATHDRRLAESAAAAVRNDARENGRAPPSLEVLFPRYLSEAPSTRSPLVGPIRYRRYSDGEWCVDAGHSQAARYRLHESNGHDARP